MKVIENFTGDPLWDTVRQSSCDFRPTTDGDLVNLSTCITPNITINETERILADCTRQIASWVLAHRNQYATGDRFQIIIGWPESVAKYNRQVVKTGGDIKDIEAIASGAKEILFMPGWTKQIFKEKDAEQGGPGYPPQSVGSPDP